MSRALACAVLVGLMAGPYGTPGSAQPGKRAPGELLEPTSYHADEVRAITG